MVLGQPDVRLADFGSEDQAYAARRMPIRQITKVTANTVEEFTKKLEDVNAAQLFKTIEGSNAAVKADVPFNPNVKDGPGTTGLAVDKSN